MNKNIVRIVAAVVDTRQLTLYKEDGTTIIIEQGDRRLRPIIEAAAPQLVKQGWAEVDISIPTDTTFADFEKGGSGAVRFFRIAKSKLKQVFNPEPAPVIDTSPVPPLSIGPVPVSASPTALPDVLPVTPAALTTAPSTFPGVDQDGDPLVDDQDEEEEEQVQETPLEPEVKQTMAAVNEILAHAIPVSSPDYHEQGIAKQGNVVENSGSTDNQKSEVREEPDTIIAVIDGKVIPGMERIKTQFDRAAKMGSTAGVEKFLARLAAVIEKRGHSVDDLLKFMERADLPIADDGTILIYKVLKRHQKDGVETGIKNRYVDCHTKKVEQFVGAEVRMAETLVDHNRRIECSNGLHVARRGYISQFSGDVCVLAKLAPEDVIAVPTYDANKMRVCAYHIIEELTPEQYSQLKANKPMTSLESGQKLLAKAMRGQHIRKTHEVRITEGHGGGVIIKELAPPATMADVPAQLISDATDATEQFGDDELEQFRDEQEAKKAAAPAPRKAEALENPIHAQPDKPTAPLDVVKTVARVTEEVQLSRKEQAKALYAAWGTAADVDKADRYAALLAFKKAAKKGWDVLGIPDPTVKVKGTVKVALAPKPNTTPKLFPAVEEAKAKPAHADVVAKLDRKVVKGDKGLPVSTKTLPMPKVKPPAVPAEASKEDGPPKVRIAKLLAIGLDSAGIAASVLAIKKSAKKSWEILGVSEAQVAKILKQTGGK